MKNRDYELLIQEIFQQLLEQDSVPNILVEHDVIRQGITTRHQLDVYWEFKLGGITFRVVVQAKNWAKPVDKGELLKFESVLRDLPGQPLGIVVTAQGYQKGALEVARAHGIKVYELKQETTPPHVVLNYMGWMRCALKGCRKDASGRPIGLVVDTEIVNPEFSNLILQADSAWVRDNGGAIPSTTQPQFPHELEFYDAEKHFLRTLRDIYSDLAKEIDGRGEASARQVHSFNSPTFLKLPSTSSFVKINGLTVEVTLKTERQERFWPSPNVAMFVLTSFDDGETRRFAQVPQG